MAPTRPASAAALMREVVVPDQPRVALVHDYLTQNGGAERVLLALHRLFPDAPVYTSLYDPSRMTPDYRAMEIRTSFLQRMPGAVRNHQSYLVCYPFAFERFDFGDYDLVISSSSAWAKGIITPPGTTHLCYCHAPMRFAWSYRSYIQGERINWLARLILPGIMAGLRRWDVRSASRVDHFLANSRAVAARIARFYGRRATVVHPPVETSHFHIAPAVDDYFLVVQRLVPYKRLDLVIDAFNELRLPLRIVGDGRARPDLERRAGPTITFTGRVSDEELRHAYAHCRAYLVPAEEDFAIAPVEAQAAGRPVIAYAAGGVLDTVLDGVTGVFFHEQTPAALAAAVRRFETLRFVPGQIRAHAQTFDTEVFLRRMQQWVESALGDRR